MGIWVRSQDKLVLKNCETIRYENFIYENSIVGESADGTHSMIGKYSSEKNALKVLDMIQGAITGKNEINVDVSAYNAEYHNVFEMPQDEEV